MFWEYKHSGGESSIRVIRVSRALSLLGRLAWRNRWWPIAADPVKLDVYKQNVIIGY